MKTLDLFGVIAPQTVNNEVNVRKFLDSLEKDEQFEVYINSPGGLVFTGVAIYNLLAEYKPTVKIIGEASSIASVIAMAGSKVLIAETALMFLHKPWWGVMGNEDDLKKSADELKTIKEAIYNSYMRKAGIDSAALESIMMQEKYMQAKEAIELKFADEIWIPTEAEKAKSKAKAFESAQLYMLNINSEIAKQPLIDINKDTKTQAKVTKPTHKIIKGKPMKDFKDALNGIERLEEKYPEGATVYANMTAFLNAREQEFGELKVKVDTLNSEIAENKTALAKAEDDKAALNETIEEQKKLLMEADVDNFMAKNMFKIDPKDQEATKKKLLALKAAEETMQIDGESLYSVECRAIEARDGKEYLTKPLDTKPEPDVATANINTLEDLLDPDKKAAFATKIQKLSKEQNKTFAEIYQIEKSKLGGE